MLLARRSALSGLLLCALSISGGAARAVGMPTAGTPSPAPAGTSTGTSTATAPATSVARTALTAPTGPVVLSIGGALRHANHDGRAEFDMAMLERLPQVSFRTQTPWYPQARKFTGPLLRDVLNLVGTQAQTIEAKAINDYKVSLPMADIQRYDVIVARLIDDQPMSLRDKGPLFLIYPFDRHVELRNSVHYGRSAWQLKSLALR